MELREARKLGRRCRCRACPYLNNIIEQDHRAVKRRVNAKQGFRSFDGAARYEGFPRSRRSCERSRGRRASACFFLFPGEITRCGGFPHEGPEPLLISVRVRSGPPMGGTSITALRTVSNSRRNATDVLQFPPHPPVQLRSITLDPAPSIQLSRNLPCEEFVNAARRRSYPALFNLPGCNCSTESRRYWPSQ